MKSRRSVTFDSELEEDIPLYGYHGELSKDCRRCLWYAKEELIPSKIEAQRIIEAINAVGGNMEAIDHSKFCVVGLEKFQNVEEKEKCRRFLIRSVLMRQEMNRRMGVLQDADSLCQISETLSQSFKEFALWQGAMHVFHAYGKPQRPDIANTNDSVVESLRAKRHRAITGRC